MKYCEAYDDIFGLSGYRLPSLWAHFPPAMILLQRLALWNWAWFRPQKISVLYPKWILHSNSQSSSSLSYVHPVCHLHVTLCFFGRLQWCPPGVFSFFSSPWVPWHSCVPGADIPEPFVTGSAFLKLIPTTAAWPWGFSGCLCQHRVLHRGDTDLWSQPAAATLWTQAAHYSPGLRQRGAAARHPAV